MLADQVVVRPHPEGAIPVVRVLVHPDLVLQQLLGQRLGLRGPRQVQPARLEQGLEAGDQVGLAELDVVAVLDRATVAVVEVAGEDPEQRRPLLEQIDDRLSNGCDIDEEGGRATRSLAFLALV